jgi:hypothetical protein
VYGLVSDESPFFDAAAYQLVKAVGEELRVFRRVVR